MKSKRSSRRRQSRRTRKYKRKGGGNNKKYGGSNNEGIEMINFSNALSVSSDPPEELEGRNENNTFYNASNGMQQETLNQIYKDLGNYQSELESKRKNNDQANRPLNDQANRPKNTNVIEKGHVGDKMKFFENLASHKDGAMRTGPIGQRLPPMGSEASENKNIQSQELSQNNDEAQNVAQTKIIGNQSKENTNQLNRQNNAATKIQSRVRGTKERNKLNERKKMRNASTKVQSRIRSKQAKGKLNELKKKRNAATKLQTGIRGRKAKRQLKELKNKKVQELNKKIEKAIYDLDQATTIKNMNNIPVEPLTTKSDNSVYEKKLEKLKTLLVNKFPNATDYQKIAMWNKISNYHEAIKNDNRIANIVEMMDQINSNLDRHTNILRNQESTEEDKQTALEYHDSIIPNIRNRTSSNNSDLVMDSDEPAQWKNFSRAILNLKNSITQKYKNSNDEEKIALYDKYPKVLDYKKNEVEKMKEQKKSMEAAARKAEETNILPPPPPLLNTSHSTQKQVTDSSVASFLNENTENNQQKPQQLVSDGHSIADTASLSGESDSHSDSSIDSRSNSDNNNNYNSNSDSNSDNDISLPNDFQNNRKNMMIEETHENNGSELPENYFTFFASNMLNPPPNHPPSNEMFDIHHHYFTDFTNDFFEYNVNQLKQKSFYFTTFADNLFTSMHQDQMGKQEHYFTHFADKLFTMHEDQMGKEEHYFTHFADKLFTMHEDQIREKDHYFTHFADKLFTMHEDQIREKEHYFTHFAEKLFAVKEEQMGKQEHYFTHFAEKLFAIKEEQMGKQEHYFTHFAEKLFAIKEEQMGKKEHYFTHFAEKLFAIKEEQMGKKEHYFTQFATQVFTKLSKTQDKMFNSLYKAAREMLMINIFEYNSIDDKMNDKHMTKLISIIRNKMKLKEITSDDTIYNTIKTLHGKYREEINNSKRKPI